MGEGLMCESCDGDSAGERNKSESSLIGRGMVRAIWEGVRRGEWEMEVGGA